MKYTTLVSRLDARAQKLINESEHGNQRNSKIAALQTPLGTVAIHVHGSVVRYDDTSKDIILSAMVHDKPQNLLTLEQHRVILPSKSKDPAVRARSIANAHVSDPFVRIYNLSPAALQKREGEIITDVSEARMALNIVKILSWGRASHDPHKNEYAREDIINVFAAEGVSAHADTLPEPSEALLASFKPELAIDERIINLMTQASPIDIPSAYSTSERPAHGAVIAP